MHEWPNLADPWAAFARYDAENGGEQRRVGEVTEPGQRWRPSRASRSCIGSRRVSVSDPRAFVPSVSPLTGRHY